MKGKIITIEELREFKSDEIFVKEMSEFTENSFFSKTDFKKAMIENVKILKEELNFREKEMEEGVYTEGKDCPFCGRGWTCRCKTKKQAQIKILMKIANLTEKDIK